MQPTEPQTYAALRKQRIDTARAVGDYYREFGTFPWPMIPDWLKSVYPQPRDL